MVADLGTTVLRIATLSGAELALRIRYWITHPAPKDQDEFSAGTYTMFTPADPANQWAGTLVYFAGDGANDNGCSGGGSFFSAGHTCDDGDGSLGSTWVRTQGPASSGLNSVDTA